MAGTCNLLNAQIGLGVRGGVNFASSELEEKIEGSWETSNAKFIPLLNFSVLGEISFSDKFAFQPEVNFIQKGYKNTISTDLLDYDYKVKMNYVEVPLLLKGKFGSEALKFTALLGPTFGYTFSGKVKSDETETDINFDEDQIKQTDLGAMLGIGVDIKAGPGSFFLDGRLGWGLSNLDDSENSDNFHWHTRNISIGVGYIYRLFE